MDEVSTEQRGWPRALVLAALCGLLAAVGHLAGGGAWPDLALLVLPLPLLAGLATTVAERSRSGIGTLAVLGLGQLALHATLEALAPAHAAHHAGSAPDGGIAMIAGHAAATLLTAAALRFADRGLAVLAAALRRVLPRAEPPPAADRPLPVLVTAGSEVRIRLARALAAGHERRGPPTRCRPRPSRHLPRSPPCPVHPVPLRARPDSRRACCAPAPSP